LEDRLGDVEEYSGGNPAPPGTEMPALLNGHCPSGVQTIVFCGLLAGGQAGHQMMAWPH
jgi:hypothetical protein